MRRVVSIDPVTRIEGHLAVNVTVDTVAGVQKVVDAQATGTMFRGIETILVGRPPDDASHITQRICGVCPVSHGLAAVMAAESAAGLTVPDNARIMRNLVLGANYVSSHILHFYHLAALDYVDGPDMPPWQPSWGVDKRIAAGALTDHYVQALDMRRKAQEMGALFGGKLPCPPAYIPGGFTCTPRSTRITQFQAYLAELTNFIQGVYLPDVQLVAGVYNDYHHVGRGYGNLLAYGVFDLDPQGNTKLLRRGRVLNGARTVQPVDARNILEDVTHSWYADGFTSEGRNPAAGITRPMYPKRYAYSWLKAPRYLRTPYEVGALARMWVNGDYNAGISVMDRHAARGTEALKVAQAMAGWVTQLQPSGPVYTPYLPPIGTASGLGLTEAPRGALGHWVTVAGGTDVTPPSYAPTSNGSQICQYQVVTPTCWNASPKDLRGQHGPMEQALIGTPVQNAAQPIEVLRVIHSFDPCLSCAVHVMRPEEGKRIYRLGEVTSGEAQASHI